MAHSNHAAVDKGVVEAGDEPTNHHDNSSLPSNAEAGAAVSEGYARLAWPTDAPEIAAIQLQHWASSTNPGLQQQAAELDIDTMAERWRLTIEQPEDARFRVLVATSGKSVAGFCITHPNQDPDGDQLDDGEVTELVISSRYRRAGHGSRLLQASIDTLRADGFNRAVTWIDTTADLARAFFESAGWQPDGAFRSWDDVGIASLRQVRLHVAIG